MERPSAPRQARDCGLGSGVMYGKIVEMRIDSIKLQGFKSFRQEAVLSFPGKITAIVGPNGSGKSNIADAFRWVMGEQSLKTLRGKESTDVIFSGSHSHSRLGRAEVMVKFGDVGSFDSVLRQARDSAQDDMFANMSEVEITRKIYSSGEASYQINRSESRLLDIQLFLAQHNVGQKNYAVIGQGMIDEILRLSPTDRLDFFYEATGVKKYQIKLHKTELKLARSSDGLAQTIALLKELAPHKKYLASQSERFIKRQEIMTDLHGKQRQYFRGALIEVSQALASKQEDFSRLEKEQGRCHESVQALEKTAYDFNTSDLSAEARNLEQERKQAEFNIGRLREKIRQLEAQKQTKLQEQGEFDTAFLYRRLSEIKDLRRQTQSQTESIAAEIAATESEIAAVTGEYQALAGKITANQKRELWSAEDIKTEIAAWLELNDIQTIKQKINSLLVALNQTNDPDQNAWSAQTAELHARLADLGVRRQVLNEKRGMQKNQDQRYEQEAVDLQLELRAGDEGSQADWLREMDQRISAYQAETDKLAEQARQLEAQIREIDERQTGRQRQMMAWQEQYQQAVSQEKHVLELCQAVKIELARLEYRRDEFLTEMSEELGEDLAALIQEEVKLTKANEFEDEPPVDLKALKGMWRKLKQEAALLGEVDESVVAEYEEVRKRYDFLAEQSTDLEAAVGTLNKIIRKLKKRIDGQFGSQFAKLNERFSEYFKELFGGGKAEVVRVELGDGSRETGDGSQESGVRSQEMGVEIVAEPPGKKVKNIMTLSGGERSLIAVALICAIVASTPPPFVILDEIDAALDDANSQRLSTILKRLSGGTQFIIITHNRATMEIADILYGVTMDESGVSKLVSVRLEDYE